MNPLHFLPLSDMAYIIQRRKIDRQARIVADKIIDAYVDNQPGYIIVEEELFEDNIKHLVINGFKVYSINFLKYIICWKYENNMEDLYAATKESKETLKPVLS